MKQAKHDHAHRKRLPVAEALHVLSEQRRDADVVVTNQGSARVWPTLSDHALDFNYNPSTMGGAIPLGLGLALAQPHREVIVLTGEGSLLMSLGSLATVAGSGATNITVVVLDNGMYEVTGGQATPATNIAVDFSALARTVGFPTVGHACELTTWREQAAAAFSNPGPRLFWLEVGPTDSAILKTRSAAIKPRVQRLRAALNNQET